MASKNKSKLKRTLSTSAIATLNDTEHCDEASRDIIKPKRRCNSKSQSKPSATSTQSQSAAVDCIDDADDANMMRLEIRELKAQAKAQQDAINRLTIHLNFVLSMFELPEIHDSIDFLDTTNKPTKSPNMDDLDAQQ